MKRKDFISIIRLRSFWKIDRRKGNYKLPSGNDLKWYVRRLVETQMNIDSLKIYKNGDLHRGYGGYWDNKNKCFVDITIVPDFQENEVCSLEEHERRLNALINEIVC